MLESLNDKRERDSQTVTLALGVVLHTCSVLLSSLKSKTITPLTGKAPGSFVMRNESHINIKHDCSTGRLNKKKGSEMCVSGNVIYESLIVIMGYFPTNKISALYR